MVNLTHKKLPSGYDIASLPWKDPPFLRTVNHLLLWAIYTMAMLVITGGYTIVYIFHMAVCQNLVPLVNIKIAGKWMFIPLKMVLIGIDPYPYRVS